MNRLNLTFIPLLSTLLIVPTAIAQDSSQPRDELHQQLRELSFQGTQLAVTPPQPNDTRSVASSPSEPKLTGLPAEIDAIAQQITVRIESKTHGNGSGVIIARNGQTYYIVTAFHVVEYQDEYTVITPDGKKYLIQPNDIVKESGLDVAILKFTSQQNYQIATLAKYNLSDSKISWIFFSGFPSAAGGKRQFHPGFKFDREQGFFQAKGTVSDLSNGYELVFTNLSLSGMSGGPLLDIKGRVIGIGGRQEGEPFSQNLDRQLGYAFGVPTTTILGLATKAGIKSEWLEIETNQPPILTLSQGREMLEQPAFAVKKPSEEADENDWLYYGNQLWRFQKYDEAVAALQQAIQINSNFHQAYYVLGLVQQFQGVVYRSEGRYKQSREKYEEAVATFREVTNKNSDYYQAWREESNTLLYLEKYSEALAAIDKAIELNSKQATADDKPRDFILYINKGNILSRLKRYQEAETVYTEAMKLKPSEIAYNNRGSVRRELKQYPEAIADFNQALAINPQYAGAYNNRGLVRKELKQYPEAIADLSQALAINPQYAEAYNNRGLVRADLKQYPEALADYEQAVLALGIADDPTVVASVLLNQGNVYIELKQYPKALDHYNLALRINPQLAEAYNSRGVVRQQLKQYPEAIADFNQALAIDPQHTGAYNNRGLVRRELKQYPEAIADFNQALAINPQYAGAYNNRGVVRKELKQYPEALADFNQAIKINPQLAEAYNNRGLVRADLKQYPEALADYTQAIKINPQHTGAYNNRGVVHRKLKQYPEAIADFDKALAINPQLAQAYFSRGLVHQELKQYPEAIADFDKALAINPQLAQAYFSRGLVRQELKQYAEAIEDLETAAQISAQQGMIDGYLISKHDLRLIKLEGREYLQSCRERYESKKYRGLEVGCTNQQLALAYLLEGYYQAGSDKYPEAIANYGRAIEINPQYAKAYNDRGMARRELKQYPEAIADFSRAIEINPQYAEAYINRGLVRRELKQYSEAIADYTRVIEINPQNVEAYNGRGIVRALLKQYPEAIADFERVIALSHLLAPTAYVNRAGIRYELKDYPGAIADLQTAAQLFQQQGNLEAAQGVQQAVRKLQSSPR